MLTIRSQRIFIIKLLFFEIAGLILTHVLVTLTFKAMQLMVVSLLALLVRTLLLFFFNFVLHKTN